MATDYEPRSNRFVGRLKTKGSIREGRIPWLKYKADISYNILRLVTGISRVTTKVYIHFPRLSCPISPFRCKKSSINFQSLVIRRVIIIICNKISDIINHLTPNGHFSGRTAPLTYRCCIF
jgi:hypothetical protein